MAANKSNVILQAAYDLFLEHGYDNASMKDIAKRAGVSQSHPYIFFESKEELFEATIRMAQNNYKQAIRETVLLNKDLPPEAFSEKCLDRMEDLRAEAIFVLASVLTPKLKPIVEKVQSETARSYIETVGIYLPDLNQEDLEAAAGLLLGLFDSYMVDGDRERVDRLGIRILKTFKRVGERNTAAAANASSQEELTTVRS